MFDYTHDQAQSHEVLRLTLSELQALNLPPNPIYFTLFYERALRRDASLTKDIDDAINAEAGLTMDRAQEIFDTHLLNGSLKEMSKAHAALLRVVRNLMMQMLTTGNEFSNYAASLGDFMRKIDRSDSIEDIRSLTAEIIDDSREIQRSTKDTSIQLTSAGDEINRLKEELEAARRDARTDPLTGLANRRGLNDLLQQRIQIFLQEKIPFCVILSDIDFFKRINDGYGHLVGDKILRFVARTLMANVKGQDTVIRFGGEEFAIVLPHTQFEGGIAVAQQLRSKIAGSRLRLAESGRDLGGLTMSFGVACVHLRDTPDALLRRADDALMQAKAQGRDQVVGQRCPSEEPAAEDL
ncbi:GGDEF domain-containing protein [Halothiobacillus sp. DCM-1]|uniref:GGDEF domain-containing protein n=1 Tax=Halothiobacillus sp. DCM-1 TaxID=3112558 RepID=UPI00324DD673